MRRFLCLAAALLAALAALPPAGAQEDGDAVTARFVRVSPWLTTERPFELTLLVGNETPVPLDELSVGISIYSRVTSRSELRNALDGRPSGSTLAVTTEDLTSPLQPGERRRIEIVRDPSALAAAFRGGGSRSGVFPVEVHVQDRRRVLARWFTAVPFFAVEPPTRLNLSWVWVAHREPTIDSAARVDDEALDATIRRSGLAFALQALAQRPAPVTVAFSGSLLDLARSVDGPIDPELDEDETPAPTPSPTPSPPLSATALPTPGAPAAADVRPYRQLLDAARRVAASQQVELATMPYARADLDALLAAGAEVDAARQITESRNAVADALGRTPSGSVLVPTGFHMTQEAADLAGALGARRLLLDAEGLPPIEDTVGGGLFAPSRPVLVRAGRGTMEALLVDADIRRRLQQPGDPILLAQSVIAETASAYLELPVFAEARLLVVASDVLPSSGVARRLLAALSRAPWLQMRTVSDALAALPPEGDPLPLPAREPGAPTPSAVAAAMRAREVVDRLRRVFTGRSPDIESLDRVVLAAQSADWSDDPNRGVSVAQAAERRAREMLGRIRAPGRSVTLTNRTGDLPVTILNESGLDATVRIELESAKVSFPEGASRTVALDDRRLTLTFPVEALTTGSFPVQVRISTPDGDAVIGTTTMVVRSTAVGPVTLMATGGGLVFLLAAWVRRRLKGRAAPPPPAEDPS